MADLSTLSPRTAEALENLPPYLTDDDLAQRVTNAITLEFERIETFYDTLREKLRPQNADDEYGLLALWEAGLKLPVNPPVSIQVRRNTVLAALKRRTTGIGESWVDLINLLLGTTGWTHIENVPSDYHLTITIPFPSTSFQAGALEALLKRITPGHLVLHISYSDAFRVGISEVGDPL